MKATHWLRLTLIAGVFLSGACSGDDVSMDGKDGSLGTSTHPDAAADPSDAVVDAAVDGALETSTRLDDAAAPPSDAADPSDAVVDAAASPDCINAGAAPPGSSCQTSEDCPASQWCIPERGACTDGTLGSPCGTDFHPENCRCSPQHVCYVGVCIH